MIVLKDIEKLKLENFQLKLELIKKTKLELSLKEKLLDKDQEQFLKLLEEEYKIDLEDYIVDLNNGILKKK